MRVLSNIVFSICVCLLVLHGHDAQAQSHAFTSEDNHAMLYAKQIQFDSDGSPIIRMRIADGLNEIHFTPEKSFYIFPDGPGGSFISLPGGKEYTISSSSPVPGKYQYAVILSRSESQGSLAATASGFAPYIKKTDTIAIGSVFALKGKLFDNREHLLITPKVTEKKEVREQLANLKQQYPDNDFDIYEELQAYPSLSIFLSSADRAIRVGNTNLMWLVFGDNKVTLHGIADEAGKPRNLKLDSSLIITPDSDAKLSIVQSASVETLLRGIVPSEIYSTAPAAALEAQTIAARTTLISQIGSRHQADPYHLCNMQHCQVYNGLNATTSQTDEAIRKTRGRVLFYENRIAQTYYSSHCGGISSSAGETWGLPDLGYLISHTDDSSESQIPISDEAVRKHIQSAKNSSLYCASAPAGSKPFGSVKHSYWEVTLTADDVLQSLKKHGQSFKSINDIIITRRGTSGRAVSIEIKSGKQTFKLERELPIRRFFNNLKSALFYFDLQKDNSGHVAKITFYGSGFGHGVGLCQTGAIGMAQRNYTADQILLHYYPNTHIDKLW